MDWRTELDLGHAIRNLRMMEKGDWYRDPWGWPEYQHVLSAAGDSIWKQLEQAHTPRENSPIEVPKENFGVRPAVQLDITEHIMYQMLVDHVIADILQEMRPDAFGWRHPYGRPPSPGRYARNDFQWQTYRMRLSDLSGEYETGLKTDITSFFASIPAERVVDELAARTAKVQTIDRLEALLIGWNSAGRSGLPQRALGSSVLANMYMQHVDELLAEYALPSSRTFGRPNGRSTFTRWMDDIWIFHTDQGPLRAAQVELQRELRSMGLILNSGKTQLLEGEDMRKRVRKVQASAVDAAYDKSKDAAPLEEIVDQILDEREVADGTMVKFVSTRMRRWNVNYRVGDLLVAAERFPHAADSLSRLFRRRIPRGEMQEWYLDYLSSRWNCFEWSTAQFGTAIPSSPRPRRSTISAFKRLLAEEAKSLPALALAAQRLAGWDPKAARGLLGERVAGESDPLLVRVLALSALQAGERPATVRRWLRPFAETQLTVQMLAARSFSPPPITADYR